MSRRARGWDSESGIRTSDPRWQRLRRRKLDATGWKCEQCGRRGRLEVHHRERLADGGPALPDLDGLETLCRTCHIDHHRVRKPLTEAEQRWAELVGELLP